MSFFSKLGAVFQAARGKGEQLAPAARSGGAFWIVVHVVVLLVGTVGLFFLGQALKLHEKIPGSPFLRQAWLPILFLLLYLLGWMAWGLWRLLRSGDDSSQFPDIDAAWQEATNALTRAGLRLTDLPLFLVIGQPESGEQSLFHAAQLPLTVKHVPAGEKAPLRVYASKDAIYVTCAGSSLLGLHAAILAGRESLVPQGAQEADADKAVTANPWDSMRPGGSGAIPAIASIFGAAEREGRPLTEYESRQIRSIHRRDNPISSLLRHPEKMAETSARLRHLCRLIVRDRAPYCPVNGLLVLIPFAGTDNDQDATDTGMVCQEDLSAARSVLRVHCPVFALVCDFETVPGFGEFIERFNARERLNRVGQRCPLVPDYVRMPGNGKGGGRFVTLLDSLVGWVCNSVMPAWVYRTFEVEGKPEAADAEAVVRKNGQLFLLASELSERQKNLSHILTRGVGEDTPDPPLFGGCYLAGTGTDAKNQQGFAAGVFQRLVEEQEAVAWTDEAREEESRYERWTVIGWVIAGVLVLATAAMVVLPG
jgi:hypothetical protein